jgi:hypothetical protein
VLVPLENLDKLKLEVKLEVQFNLERQLNPHATCGSGTFWAERSSIKIDCIKSETFLKFQ